MRSLTLEHVAKAAGVSRATVSRVVNGTRNVDPEIRAIVQNAIARTGYVPNRAARSLVTRRTGSIALVVSDPCAVTFDDTFLGRAFSDPYFGRLVGGALGELRLRRVRLELMLAETEDARDDLVGMVRQGDVDGVLLISLHSSDPLPGLLAEASLPAVLLGRPLDDVRISYVDVDNVAGASLAAERLIGRGCRRVATIAGPPDAPGSNDRLEGFRAALASHGHELVAVGRGNFTCASGESAMESLLAEHPDIDGLFAANDLMAQGALLVLRDHSRRVPTDVAVVGYDDSSVATTSRPHLTTVRQPLEAMAAAMARMLLDDVDQPLDEPRSTIFTPSLVVRDSA